MWMVTDTQDEYSMSRKKSIWVPLSSINAHCGGLAAVMTTAIDVHMLYIVVQHPADPAKRRGMLHNDITVSYTHLTLPTIYSV